MGTLSVQDPKQGLKQVRFVSVQESLTCEILSCRTTCRWTLWALVNFSSYVIAQTFKERPQVPVGRLPIPAH